MDDTLPDNMRWVTTEYGVSMDAYGLSHERVQKSMPDYSAKCSKQIKQDKQMNYQFHVTAPSAQVSFDTIAKDLSYKNPLAFVEIDTEKEHGLYVLFHYSILQKRELVFGTEVYVRGMQHFDGYSMIEVESKSEFSDWIDWAKSIKKMEWPECMRDKGVVTVSLPKV